MVPKKQLTLWVSANQNLPSSKGDKINNDNR